MSDETPEQKAADETLREAVTNACRAYYGSEVGLVMDYVVIVTGKDFESMDSTSVATLVSEPLPPIHTQMGMLHYVLTRQRASISGLRGED